ncbi:uncharacterized protein TNCT_423371 [Trichonephila clavata]|uniref:Uncharacterized protein n=1 Tax=Trichonephila clavata TaxID=2740835 RepID=A0A8X6HB95_TRICU|nr:uncharacterized protein TNCT_423371 [Trichonephila clavata]
MPYAFPQWESARRLNEQIKVTPHTCQYVLLLNQTNCFDIEKDLRKILKINHKPLVWFINTFQKHRVRVEYAVLFTQRELSVFGPIAHQQTHGILSKRFETIYGECQPIFVSLPGVLKNCGVAENPFQPFPLKHLETELQTDLKRLLQQKVVYQCLVGGREETIEQHRWKVLQQVAEWLHIPHALSTHQDDCVKDQVLQLLSKGIKRKHFKKIPQDESEWTHLLNVWLRRNTMNQDVKERDIYRWLAVDGFDGFEAKHLKLYLLAILDQKCIRQEYRLHIKAVRAMYRWFESQPQVSSLTGTDSGCVVFLTLLQLYVNKLEMMEDEITLQVHLAKRSAEGFLHRNANYYKDVRNVTEALLQELGNIYVQEWQGKDWTSVANEQLGRLMKSKN